MRGVYTSSIFQKNMGKLGWGRESGSDIAVFFFFSFEMCASERVHPSWSL